MPTHRQLQSRKRRLFAVQDARCALCAGPLVQIHGNQLDHIQPKSEQGKNGIENLRLVHKGCHTARHWVTPKDVSESIRTLRVMLVAAYLLWRNDEWIIAAGWQSGTLRRAG